MFTLSTFKGSFDNLIENPLIKVDNFDFNQIYYKMENTIGHYSIAKMLPKNKPLPKNIDNIWFVKKEEIHKYIHFGNYLQEIIFVGTSNIVHQYNNIFFSNNLIIQRSFCILENNIINNYFKKSFDHIYQCILFLKKDNLLEVAKWFYLNNNIDIFESYSFTNLGKYLIAPNNWYIDNKYLIPIDSHICLAILYQDIPILNIIFEERDTKHFINEKYLNIIAEYDLITILKWFYEKESLKILFTYPTHIIDKAIINNSKHILEWFYDRIYEFNFTYSYEAIDNLVLKNTDYCVPMLDYLYSMRHITNFKFESAIEDAISNKNFTILEWFKNKGFIATTDLAYNLLMAKNSIIVGKKLILF